MGTPFIFNVFYLVMIVITAVTSGAMIERGSYSIVTGCIDAFIFLCAVLVLCDQKK